MELLREKRGISRLQSFIIYVLLGIFIMLNLLSFINRASSGELLEEQILAKQVALLIETARPGTEIFVFIDKDYSVEISGNKVNVKSEKSYFLYSYDFFTSYKVSADKQDKKLVIIIS